MLVDEHNDSRTYIIVALTAALNSALRFTAVTVLTESAFSPKPEATLRPFLMHFEQHVGLRNQKILHTYGGGVKKWTRYLFIGTGEKNETTWQLKPKRTAAASLGFLAVARLSCTPWVYFGGLGQLMLGV